MKSFLVTILTAVVICLCFGPVSFAQEEDQPPEEGAAIEVIEAPAPPSLNVTPDGIARQDWEVVRDIVLAVPNPAEGALPGVVDGGWGPGGASAGLMIDGAYVLYTYDCGSGGRCRGFATDIWRGLPQDTQQSYIDSIMDALIANFPGEPRYTVWLEGRDAKGYLGARVDWAGNGDRRYRFVGNPTPAPVTRPTGSTSRP